MNKIPLVHTGLYNPHVFNRNGLTLDRSFLPNRWNSSIIYGKVGKVPYFHQIKYFLNSNKNEKYRFLICENKIGFLFFFFSSNFFSKIRKIAEKIILYFFFLNLDNIELKIPMVENISFSNCGKGFFQCKQDLYCISMRFICDGINDCDDKTDEKECKNYKLEKYECDKNSTKIPYFLVCDGIHDCQDKSDEKNCSSFREKIFFFIQLSLFFFPRIKI